MNRPLFLWANSFDSSNGLYSDDPVLVFLNIEVSNDFVQDKDFPAYLYFSDHRAANHMVRCKGAGLDHHIYGGTTFASTNRNDVVNWTEGVKSVLYCLNIMAGPAKNYPNDSRQEYSSWHGRSVDEVDELTREALKLAGL
jgi:hypothetical protein